MGRAATAGLGQHLPIYDDRGTASATAPISCRVDEVVTLMATAAHVQRDLRSFGERHIERDLAGVAAVRVVAVATTAAAAAVHAEHMDADLAPGP